MKKLFPAQRPTFKLRHTLPGSTLAELLVLMIIAGIIFLSVFDGFSLFQRFVKKVGDHIDDNIARVSGYNKLSHMFSTSDSICGDPSLLRFYRQGEVWSEVAFLDSMLVERRAEIPDDTLMLGISPPRIAASKRNPRLIDSLIVVRGSTTLRFGIKYNPALTTENELTVLEEQYESK